MVIDVTGPQSTPVWPEGIELRPFERGPRRAAAACGERGGVRRRVGTCRPLVRHLEGAHPRGRSASTRRSCLSSGTATSSPASRSTIRSGTATGAGSGRSRPAGVATAGARSRAPPRVVPPLPRDGRDDGCARRRRREPDGRHAAVRAGGDARPLAGGRLAEGAPARGAARCERAPRALPALPHADGRRVRRRLRVPQLRDVVRGRASSASLGRGAQGGDAMAQAAALELPYPEALVVERDTLEEQTAAVAAGLPRARSCSAAAAARTSARSAVSRRDTTGSRSSGSTPTATSTRPETSPSGNLWGMPLRMAIDEGSVAPADVALVGARDLDPPELEYLARARDRRRPRPGARAAPTRSTSRSTSTSSSRARSRHSCPRRAGRPSRTPSGAPRGRRQGAASPAWASRGSRRAPIRAILARLAAAAGL